MNVYFCISEEVKTYGGGEYEPPEYGCICEIVMAKTRSQARLLAWKNSRDGRHNADLMEMPRFSVRKLGQRIGDPRVLSHDEADSWWARVPDDAHAPGVVPVGVPSEGEEK